MSSRVALLRAIDLQKTVEDIVREINRGHGDEIWRISPAYLRDKIDAARIILADVESQLK